MGEVGRGLARKDRSGGVLAVSIVGMPPRGGALHLAAGGDGIVPLVATARDGTTALRRLLGASAGNGGYRRRGILENAAGAASLQSCPWTLCPTGVLQHGAAVAHLRGGAGLVPLTVCGSGCAANSSLQTTEERLRGRRAPRFPAAGDGAALQPLTPQTAGTNAVALVGPPHRRGEESAEDNGALSSGRTLSLRCACARRVRGGGCIRSDQARCFLGLAAASPPLARADGEFAGMPPAALRPGPRGVALPAAAPPTRWKECMSA